MSLMQQQRIQYIQELFESNPDIFNYEYPQIQNIKAKGSKKVTAVLPLKKHPVFGETVLYISENYADGKILKHHYGWEVSQIKGRIGKAPRHITAFGNEDHPEPPNNVPSNPYHHHHVPKNPGPRKSTNVQDLQSVVEILRDYIVGGVSYHQSHKF